MKTGKKCMSDLRSAVCVCALCSIIIHNVETLDIYHRQRRLSVNDKCDGVQATLENVFTCPENNDILLERSSRKKCESFPQCQKEPLVYHCVRFEEELVEVTTARYLKKELVVPS